MKLTTHLSVLRHRENLTSLFACYYKDQSSHGIVTGYYVHIHSMNEVREQVFKYIPVIARPLVLQGMMHPTVWTHPYADTTVS